VPSASSFTKAALLTGVAAGAVGAWWWWERRRQSHKLAVTPAVIEFGAVEAGREAHAVILLSNAGLDAVEVTSVDAPEHFRVAGRQAPPFALTGGETAIFRVSFAPSAAGERRGRILFSISDTRRQAAANLGVEVTASSPIVLSVGKPGYETPARQGLEIRTLAPGPLAGR
jgi:hypothetical protein